MRITTEELIAMGACEEAVEWFQRTFPDGARITPETLAQCAHDNWVCWLAGQKSESYRCWYEGLTFRELPDATVNASNRLYAEMRAEAERVLCAL